MMQVENKLFGGIKMTGQEKFDHAMSMKPFARKQDIPVFPHTCTFAAVPAGMTQADIFKGNDAWMEAYKKTSEIVGWPDVAFPLGPKTVTYIEQMPVRIPGKDLGDNELFQFVEAEIAMKEEDYDLIIEKGFGAWQMPYVASIQNPPFTGPLAKFKTIFGFIKSGMEVKKNKKFWDSKHIPLMFHSGTAPAFDTFSMSRGMGDFCCDLYDIPEKVKAACEKATPEIIKTAINGVKSTGGNRIAIFAMRSSATFISPDMFEEFAWPGLKQMIEAFYEAGIISVVHADANWLPMLPYFREVPKGSCIIELDSATDIEKAYEILKGYQIIRGDVPPTLMAFGTEEEVKAYCDKLINLAMGGGFIIGTGCEVPLNSKVENLRALIHCTE